MGRPRQLPKVQSQTLKMLFLLQESRKWSDSELEARSGVSKTKISEVRRGLRKASIDEVEWMLEALGCNLVIYPKPPKGKRQNG